MITRIMIIIIILCFNSDDFAVDQKWPSPPRLIVSILYHSFKSHWWNLLEVLTMVADGNVEQDVPTISILWSVIDLWSQCTNLLTMVSQNAAGKCLISILYSVIDPLQKSFGRWLLRMSHQHSVLFGIHWLISHWPIGGAARVLWDQPLIQIHG